MYLSELSNQIGHKELLRFRDVEIGGIAVDSKHVMQGDLFVCFAGGEHDGHEFAEEAAQSGAVALVVERALDIDLPQIVVEDGRRAATELSAVYYGHPERKLKIVGVTGTNGKTTTAHMLASVLTAAGKSCGIIGTLGIYYANKEIAPELTTPDPSFLYKIFTDMVACGVEYAVMEVSAHALYFGKVDGIHFEAGIFTNLTEDHLDFFKTMEEYAAAKEKLFEPRRCRFAVLNFDDAEGRRIGSFAEGAFSYALENPADVFAVDIRESFDGCSFVINLFDELYDIHLKIAGLHNVYNAMAAAACAKLLGVSVPIIAAGLSGLKRVRGRLEHVARYRGADIFVDFAHTPDGLEKSLSALRRHCVGRLICVFGCGGNRETEKRPRMGEISARLADFTVITSDNPRYEDPFDIAVQIEQGVRGVTDRYVIVLDRESAIEYALGILSDGDVLLIAGKGGENYQEVMGVKHIYNDIAAVRSIIGAVSGKEQCDES